MNIFEMRKTILLWYPSKRWAERVQHMPDRQVMAIYWRGQKTSSTKSNTGKKTTQSGLNPGCTLSLNSPEKATPLSVVQLTFLPVNHARTPNGVLIKNYREV